MIVAVGEVIQVDAPTRNVTIDLAADRLRAVHVPDAVDLSSIAGGDTVRAVRREHRDVAGQQEPDEAAEGVMFVRACP